MKHIPLRSPERESVGDKANQVAHFIGLAMSELDKGHTCDKVAAKNYLKQADSKLSELMNKYRLEMERVSHGT